MQIGIIGAGIGGLASAIRMAVKGHQVTIFEKNSYPGGKLAELRLGPYRFDTGPSLFTLPQLVDELFELAGENIKDFLDYDQLDVVCKYFFHDDTQFVFYQDQEKLRQELAQKTKENPSNLNRHLLKAEEAYNISAGVFIFNSLHKLSNYQTEPYKKVLFKLHKLDFFRSMHRANRKQFKDHHLVQLFDRYATYNGSDPFRAPATLNIIAHLENNIGAFFPKKGMYAIAQSLYDLALKKGVSFKFNEQVDEILISKKQVKGIRAGTKIYDFDSVISDSDIHHVANHMMNHPKRKRINRLEPSSSALIFYWGIKRSFPELDLHNILFAENYKAEFNAIFRQKVLADDLTVYIFISSKLVPGDAPEGCENWFVMINAPANSGQDWDKMIAQARKNIVSKINKRLNINIEEFIEQESIASPITIEETTLSARGALYGSASNSMFSAFLRHPNFLSGIKNLYFVGGSVHPGGGIPLCLASAGIVDQEIPMA